MPTGIYKRTKPVWNKKPEIKLSCQYCNRYFGVKPSRKETAKYCSKKCFFASKKGKQAWSREKVKCICLQCKEVFYIWPSLNNAGKNKYCSHRCYGLSKRGISPWNKGLKMSLHTRSNMSKAGKKRMDKQTLIKLREIGFNGVKKQQNMNGPTSIEKKVHDELIKRGVSFETQKLINNKFLVDIYISNLNLIIEIDGKYWHNLDKVKKKDKAENAYLKKCGFNLLRLTETEINSDRFKERLGD